MTSFEWLAVAMRCDCCNGTGWLGRWGVEERRGGIGGLFEVGTEDEFVRSSVLARLCLPVGIFLGIVRILWLG